MSMGISLSVIIPTYNRVEALEKCLNALGSQVIDSDYEVLVIDDGSNDGTDRFIRSLQEYYPVPLKYWRQANMGPATARNRGIQNARGEILLFIGDDIIAAEPAFLKEHLTWHRENYREGEVAVLGYTTWSSEITISPFMRWLENGGPQFSYKGLGHGSTLDARHFYTSNISLKKSFLGKDLFDERFPYAAYEDTELGYRLAQRGLKIVFNREALAYHYHQITLDSYCKRAFLAGRSAAILACIQPDAFHKRIHPSWRKTVKRFFFEGIGRPFSMSIARFCEQRMAFPSLFMSLYSHYFWMGYREEVKEKSFR